MTSENGGRERAEWERRAAELSAAFDAEIEATRERHQAEVRALWDRQHAERRTLLDRVEEAFARLRDEERRARADRGRATGESTDGGETDDRG